MGSKRRYLPIAKYPIYSRAFDMARMQSKILTPESIPSVYSILWDEINLKVELKKVIDYKTNLGKQLEDLQFRFEDIKNSCRNQGKEIPEIMPENLLNEKYEIEAKIDVAEEEKELLESRMKVIADNVKKEVNNKMLQYGPVCSFHFHGTGAKDPKMMNVMKEIDGQNVSMCLEGFLIIDDEDSPYNGMAITDYRKMSKMWINDRMKADEELLAKMQEKARLNGEQKPYRTGRSLRGTIAKADLPKFPSWAKKYSMTIVEAR